MPNFVESEFEALRKEIDSLSEDFDMDRALLDGQFGRALDQKFNVALEIAAAKEQEGVSAQPVSN